MERKTKEQIVKPFIYIDGTIPVIENTDCYDCMQSYADQESRILAEGFAEWCSKNGYIYYKAINIWIKSSIIEKTTEKLYDEYLETLKQNTNG